MNWHHFMICFVCVVASWIMYSNDWTIQIKVPYHISFGRWETKRTRLLSLALLVFSYGILSRFEIEYGNYGNAYNAWRLCHEKIMNAKIKIADIIVFERWWLQCILSLSCYFSRNSKWCPLGGHCRNLQLRSKHASYIIYISKLVFISLLFIMYLFF